MYSNLALKNEEYSLLKNDKKYLEKLIKNAHNKEAFAELYRVTKTAVYGYVLSILKNKADAEDVFQDVYIKVYENHELYKCMGRPLSWMLMIAKNESLMKIRKRKNNVDFDIVKEFIPDKKKINVDDSIILTAAFKEISDEEREILVFHVLGGLKHREIARLLEVPVSTILSKYNRTLKKLRDALKEEKI